MAMIICLAGFYVYCHLLVTKYVSCLNATHIAAKPLGNAFLSLSWPAMVFIYSSNLLQFLPNARIITIQVLTVYLLSPRRKKWIVGTV